MGSVKDQEAPWYNWIMVAETAKRFYQVEISDTVREGRECERFAWLSNEDLYSDDPFRTVTVFEDRNAEMFMLDFPMSEVTVLSIV